MEIHSFMVLVPMIAGNSNKLIAVWNYVIIAIQKILMNVNIVDLNIFNIMKDVLIIVQILNIVNLKISVFQIASKTV